MAIIDLDEVLKTDDQKPQQFGEVLVKDRDVNPGFVITKGTKTLEENFPKLNRDKDIHFMSHGEWSTHELIMHLLTLIGPAHLYFTTWSLKEYPVRLLMKAMEEGRLMSIYALLDTRVKVRNPEVLALAQMQFATVREYDCHAKVAVLMNEDWKVTVIGSANMTNNPRVEACVLSTHPEVADFHYYWISKLINAGEELHGD